MDRRKGRFFEGLQPLREGGREHDLTFDAESSTWLKFTKPSAAGYGVSFDFDAPSLEPALPLEYLERLALQNEIFADTVTFVGVGGSRALPRIITRQPDIPGTSASCEEIVTLMVQELTRISHKLMFCLVGLVVSSTEGLLEAAELGILGGILNFVQ